MTANLGPIDSLPAWVPAAVRLYLTHTESGRSLRDIARAEGVHASTVMRQVRRFENRRDDPLVDSALGRLRQTAAEANSDEKTGQEPDSMTCTLQTPDTPAGAPEAACSLPAVPIDEGRLTAEARRVLRRMAEPGALMAVAADMDRAVVLRDGPGGAVRLAVLERPVAEAFVLRDWIACRKPGRVAQYEITATGRQSLRKMLAETGERDVPSGAGAASPDLPEDEAQRAAPPLGESPVATLARRRDRNGHPFLAQELVAAAERLREDFEIAQMGPQIAQNWERFLTAGCRAGPADGVPLDRGQRAARERLAEALGELGPGLGDMALRCCCYLEGLETAERRLGWSARSGKIVLRIALERLRRHYDSLGEAGKLIG